MENREAVWDSEDVESKIIALLNEKVTVKNLGLTLDCFIYDSRWTFVKSNAGSHIAIYSHGSSNGFEY